MPKLPLDAASMTSTIASFSAHRSTVDLFNFIVAAASEAEAREELSRASRPALAALETAENAAVLMLKEPTTEILLFFLERIVARHGPNARSRDLPLLSVAAVLGRHDAVSFLLGAGANPRLTDDRGLTALMHAAQQNSSCLPALLPVSDLLARSPKRGDALSIAIAMAQHVDTRAALSLLVAATVQAATVSGEARESGAHAYRQAIGGHLLAVADLLTDFADPARLAEDVRAAGQSQMPRGFALAERASLANAASGASAPPQEAAPLSAATPTPANPRAKRV
jgi:hypothetical protein